MGEFRMPSLGADMDAGTIVEWRVRPGDLVQRGEVVAVVATDKADIDVEVFESGAIEELLVPVGVKVPVGTPLARIGGALVATGVVEPSSVAPVGSALAAPELAAPALGAERPTAPAALGHSICAPSIPTGRVRSPVVRHLAERLHVDTEHVRGSGPGGVVTRRDVEAAASRRPRVSPRARRLAAARGVDITALRGSGPGGAVTGADVEGALIPAAGGKQAPVEPAREPPAPSTVDRAASMRLAIANLMARSAREIPHYHLRLDIDLEATLLWLAAENERRPVAERLLPAAMLIKATALAAADVPAVNGHWVDASFVPGTGVNVGVAVSLRGGGLIAPAIHDADRLSLSELMSALRDLVGRARTGHLKGSELTGGTITVTNLGDNGVDLVHGVIYPPQVALVGFGRIGERPWADHGLLGVRRVVTATLAADHRASDGLVGARFLDGIARHLHAPEEL